MTAFSSSHLYPGRLSICYGRLSRAARRRRGRLVRGRGEFPGDEGALSLFEGDAGLLGDVVEDLLAAGGLLVGALDRAGEEPVKFGRFAGSFVDDWEGNCLAEESPEKVRRGGAAALDTLAG